MKPLFAPARRIAAAMFTSKSVPAVRLARGLGLCALSAAFSAVLLGCARVQRLQ